MPYDDAWVAARPDPPEFHDQYLSALERFADRLPAARIPVERIAGEVVLTAGGRRPRSWPSTDFADEVAARRPGAADDGADPPHAPGTGSLLPGETAAAVRGWSHGGSAGRRRRARPAAVDRSSSA